MERTGLKQLEILYKVSHLAASHSGEISGFLDDTLKILETDMGIRIGTFTMKRPDGDEFAIAASIGLTLEEKEKGRYRLGEGITGRVAKTAKPIIIPDISKDSHFLGKARSGDSLSDTAFICVSIVHAKSVIGTMSIWCPTEAMEDLRSKERFLRLVANILAETVAAVREQAEERESLKRENELLRLQLKDHYALDKIIGRCGNMRVVFQQIAQVADSTANVLIRGESGTGKELVASAIHFNSDRKNNPFVAVNCAALPESLIESELFGHEKGAFTGAFKERSGRFAKANGGTIFLDEIGDIPLSVQVRLLRVLQERSYEPVGGDSTRRVNVRIVAATNKDLERAVAAGSFREDLFYRLNVFPIHLPPLRQRRSDIMLLADHFLQKYNDCYNKNIMRISTSAINMMMAYHWPGNVRELENCIERAVLTASDKVIHGYNLPPSLQTSNATHTELVPEDGVDLKAMVDSYEKEIIIDTLKKTRGNASAAAKLLKTTQRILNYRLRKLDITSTRYR
ncbi:MAG: GAF domain-containing protein [Kiritimatiellaeota bacterium]|nr:GAF domain-containing protein [Kiritimatiellota bacterium]